MRSQYAGGRDKKRRFTRRIRRKSPLYFLLCALLIGVLACGCAFLARLAEQKSAARYDETFLPGVRVNGQELTGMSREEAVEALSELYADRLKQQVTIRCGEQTWVFSPADAQARVDVEEQVDAAYAYGKEGDAKQILQTVRELKANPVDLPLTLSYDEEALDAFVQAIKQAVDRAPVDATISIDGSEKPQITNSSSGLELDAEQLQQQLARAILSGEGGEIELEPTVLQPEVDTMDVSSEFILLAECTTSLEGSSSARNSNVALALSSFNGLVLENGKQVSFNKLVGDRTEANGFKEANEYAGTTVVRGIGGGVCQAATTLYGAILRVPLQIDERSNHKMSVSYVPASQDAAVSYPDKDLVFTNTIGETLYFFAGVDTRKKTAYVKIYGAALDIDYYVSIRSEILERDIKSSSVVYKEDTTGEKAWYTDQKVLYKVGKTGMRSRAYRQYINLATGEVIHEELLGEDYYQPESDIYWIGVHER